MVQLECDPKLARQGAAALLCVAATAAAMPLIAGRGAEQREQAFWAAKAAEFQDYMQASATETTPGNLIHLASFSPNADGVGAFGTVQLNEDALERNAIAIAARVRGGFAFDAIDPPAEQGMLQKMTRSLREQHCLAQAVYYEARSESYEGQLAVAEVVRNRVKAKLWPDTYCGVVYEGSQRSTGCQFTFTCDGSMKIRPRGPAWRQAQAIAAEVYGGLSQPITGAATHYHTTAVDPSWNNAMIITRRIGSHIFFRVPSRSERAAQRAEASLRGRYDQRAPAAQAAAPTKPAETAAAPQGEVIAPPVETAVVDVTT